MPFLALLAFAALQEEPGYLNPNLPPKERAQDLVVRMSLDEKISQMQNQAAGIPRLKIPPYDWWSEALHGAVGFPVTVFPQAIGLSSTFDTTLMRQVATAISDEGRARYADAIAHNRHGMHEGLTFWAPNINIFRDPRWGRGQETYGEDPFLTGRMAVTFVKAMQGEENGKLKTVATPKHYAVHSGPDPDRHRFNAVPTREDLWNTYLPAFRAAVSEGGAWSVMSAYSSVDGVPDSANKMLLDDILRKDFGFRGYVVSDCGAIYDIQSGHHYTNDLAEAAAAAVKAGCDLECGDAYKHLHEAVDRGLIDQPTIDKSVERLMEARIRLGMFDPPASSGPWAVKPMSVVNSPEHRTLALRAARESIVLLKNDGFLPLKNVHHIAVIGPNADDRGVPLGNYNGTPSHTVTVYEGLKNLAPAGTEVTYTQGSARTEGLNAAPIPASALPGGVHAEFFGNENLQGTPIFTSDSPALDFDWGNDAPNSAVPQVHYSARFTATLVAPKTGEYRIGTKSDDGGRVKIDGKVIEEDWSEHPAKMSTGTVQLEAGHSYKVEVEFYQHEGQASISLVWALPGARDYQDAVDAAKASEAVVMVLGISGEIENEELDRKSIELPSIQQGLLKAVEATGKPVVVVLESGSCIALDPKPLRGLVEAWYPGEEGGTAVAEILYGKTNPSGRLPVTFYKSLAQVPAFDDYKMKDRTYRYMREKPLYPFGYGLSYTRFTYEGPAAVTRLTGVTDHFSATVKVANSGKFDGDEVVQVYAERKGAVWPEPLRKLVGFKRIHLRAGERQLVDMEINLNALRHADAEGNLKLVPGEYRFSVGGGIPGMEPETSGKDAATVVRL
ncbi:MAG TPA: glycoside hydrolase family 3 C-terminal domain-containing protein [Fimbriimonas sp.]|nr:glycoside hydrolase family 3 C-terminal domain-containing protein [Fimbriimonas sp.]